jgi:glycosyltransferase involved in cell wall biosynthesis
MDILISIIVPVYNVEPYLDRCIQSLICQTYKKLEIILVNDGSTDLSGSICDDYAKNDERIRVFHIKNGGSSIARNYGLKNCNGEYIGFVDSDDWIKPEMYFEMLNFSVENNLKVVECSSIELHLAKKTLSITSEIKRPRVEDRDAALKRIIANKRFAVWRRLYHTSILKNRYFIEGVIHQDVYYTIDILNEITEIGFFENHFYVYNVQNPTSVIRSNYSLKRLKSINAGAYVLENTTQYDNDIQDIAKQYLFEFLTYHYDSLYFNPELDKDGNYRKNIRNKIKKYYNVKKIHFYSYSIVILPPMVYKIFLFTNKKRIKIQTKISQMFRNV